MHSEVELAVIVKDSIQTDLENRANKLYVTNYGEEIKIEPSGVRMFFAVN
jgi:hypothetical protein